MRAMLVKARFVREHHRTVSRIRGRLGRQRMPAHPGYGNPLRNSPPPTHAIAAMDRRRSNARGDCRCHPCIQETGRASGCRTRAIPIGRATVGTCECEPVAKRAGLIATTDGDAAAAQRFEKRRRDSMRRFVLFGFVLLMSSGAAFAQSARDVQDELKAKMEVDELKAKLEALAQATPAPAPFGPSIFSKGKKEPTAALQTGLQGTWWREPYWIKELTLMP